MLRPTTATGRRRTAFTLAELLMVIVLFGLVMATFVRVIARQQRFYKGASDIMDMRSQMRQTLGVLPFDLRAAASGAGDIASISDSSITFWAQTGSSIVCFRQSNAAFLIPGPQGLKKLHKLSGWIEEPVDGDRILIYDDGKYTGFQDDAWRWHTITTASPESSAGANACPTTTNFTTSTDTATGYRITLTSPDTLETTILVGAPIRFMRKVRYRAYTAGDGQWYVGYQDSTAAGWSATSPVGGPFRPYVSTAATPDTSGIRFFYYDSAGSTTTDRMLVARMDIALRGRTPGVLDIAGFQRQRYTDTLRMSVGLRNRR